MKIVYMYKAFERFWHWTQALLIIFLIITGFEVHSSFELFGYENSVIFHRYAGYALGILYIFAVFWHYSTGEWKQYVPTTKFLKEQVLYYLVGIFKNEPHPTIKTVDNKLNPLQRLAYLGLMVFLIPLMLVTGLLYVFYRYPDGQSLGSLNVAGLEPIAILHTIGAFAILAFLIGHLYLTTTGHTVLANIKAMITGYEEVEEEHENKKDNKN